MRLHEEGADGNEPDECAAVAFGHGPCEEHEEHERQHRDPGVPRIHPEVEGQRPDEQERHDADERHQEYAPAAAGNDQRTDERGDVQRTHRVHDAGRAEQAVPRREVPEQHGARVVPTEA